MKSSYYFSSISCSHTTSEITKDSSGSVSASGPENFTDEEMDGRSSTSGAISNQHSPITPDRQFYGDAAGRGRPHPNHAHPPHGRGPHPSVSSSPGAKYSRDMDTRDSYRDPDDPRGHSVKGHMGRDHHHGRPISGKRDSRDPNSRPTSGKVDPLTNRPISGKRDMHTPGSESGKKRDYFEGHELNRRDRERGYRASPHYDASESSYSELLDNNQLTTKKIRDDIPDSDLIDYEDDGGESLVESVELEYDETRVRIFIALFDYDPSTMSPNPDAADEELPFKEGQLLKVCVQDNNRRKTANDRKPSF